jgi:hypothetical protein
MMMKPNSAVMAGEGMDAECARDAVVADGCVENGVIRRMEHAVADAADDDAGDEKPPGGGERKGGVAEYHQRQTDRQHQLGAVSVDQDAGRHLGDAGRQCAQAHHQADLGVADAEILVEEVEERRQAHQVEVAAEMARADEAENLRVLAGAVCRCRRHDVTAPRLCGVLSAQPTQRRTAL